MRLHRLRLTAFGPFPGTELVDLDALASGGLFLLHGPTGAGKTSVLDAVCFALYGRVPGARGATARLRSDHADPTMAPEVVCEFSVGTRRFEVTRSPAWERPKKRGGGTTTQQARVVVREWDATSWRPLTTRADEAGQLLDQVLGLGLDQFTKLVLLPQGEFAAFLRADAEIRRQMLERLFGTDRFTAVQQWMRQHQLELRHEVDEAEHGTQVLLAQARQAAAPLGLPAPDPDLTGSVDPESAGPGTTGPESAGPESAGLGTVGAGTVGAGTVGPGTVGADPPGAHPALDQVLQSGRAARHAFEDAVARRAATQDGLRRAELARHHGEELSARRHEHDAAAARLAQLRRSAADQDHRRRRLDQATRAAGLVPVAATLRAGVERAESAARRLSAAKTAAFAVSPLAAEQTRAMLADGDRRRAVADAGRRELARLVEAQRDDVRLGEQDREVDRLGAQLATAEAEAGRVRDHVEEGERTLARLRQRHADAAVTAAGADDARDRLAAAEATLRALEQRRALLARLPVAHDAWAAARQTRDDARERWLDVRERRLAGIAAELAAGLEPGAGCPVCGSLDHPSPARHGAGTEPVDRTAEQTAQQQVEQAEATLAAAEGALVEVRTRLAAVEPLAGGLDSATAQAQRDAAASALAAAEAAAGELATVQTGLGEQERALAGWAVRRSAADATLLTAAGALAAARELADDLRRRVDAARGDDDTVAARLARVQAWTDALDAVTEAERENMAAAELLRDATAAADRAAAEAGFATVDEALAAVADPAVVAQLQADCRRYDDELAAVTTRLADPELADAAARPAPAPADLRAAEELARCDDEAAAARVAVCETALAGLDRIADELARHLASVAPLLDRYRTAEQLSRCLDGTGGDNTRRMSLSAYVLAARLEQVAEAAGQRLAAMSGGRYTLVHSDDRARGRLRSGLSLRVVDGWTGAERETASLSGGESFYTSLALALGLADVVTAEAGGAVMETLFVDEGFGTLDEDTLDEVMDVLDGLRTGGRTIGLVSHVPDLRQRIPARLEVVKTPTGSRLLPATA